MDSRIDYSAVFKVLPGASALLNTDLVILDANNRYLEISCRQLEDLVGRKILDAFQGNPLAPGDGGPGDLRASLETVIATGERDTIHMVRYDLEDLSHPGLFDERFWSIINTPVCADDGTVVLIVHRVEEATHIVHQARASDV